MNDLATLESLYRHMEWADASLWRLILGTEGVADDERVGFLMHHIHVVQNAFHSVWRGQPLDNPERDTFDDAAAVCRWGQTRHRALQAFLADLAPARLATEPEVPWTALVAERIGRNPEMATLGEMALQVAFHSAHHRAQVSTRLRELGGEPPLIDFIGWVWLGKPAADWPA